MERIDLASICIEPLVPIDLAEPLLYEAEVKLLGRSFTGLLYVQKQTWDRVEIAMVSHFGLSIFEASFTPRHYTFHSILPLLDKPRLRTTIAHYLSLFTAVTIPPLQTAFIVKKGEPIYRLHATQSPLLLTLAPSTNKIKRIEANQLYITQDITTQDKSPFITIRSHNPIAPILILQRVQ